MGPDTKPEEEEQATQDEIDRLLQAWEDKEYFEWVIRVPRVVSNSCSCDVPLLQDAALAGPYS
jgi:hypothetical protein